MQSRNEVIKIVKATKKKIDYINEFNKQNYKSYHIRFNKNNDKELINHIDKHTNKNEYFKSLVEADIINDKSK